MKNILILGAPRSGTSFTVKAFARIGVDFGEVSMGQHENAGLFGYGEDVIINNLVAAQIAGSGGTCNGMVPTNIIPLSIGKEDIEREIQRDKSGIMGVKSPLMAYSLPWWLQNGFEGWTIAVILRDPVAMALSYHRVNHTPIEYGFSLWKRTYSDLLLWEQIFALDYHWIHFPSMAGFVDVAHSLGLEASQDEITSMMDDPKFSRGDQRFPAGLSYLDEMYKMLIGRVVYDQPRTDCSHTHIQEPATV
jgi:hypothetical protein